MSDIRRARARRGRRVVMALCAAACAITGCSKKQPEQRTVLEIKRDYAQKFVEGMAYGGSGRIKAASFDDRTFVLRRVTIDGEAQIISADRAEIIVDVTSDTIRLRLFDVIGADTGDPRTDDGSAGAPGGDDGGVIGEAAVVTTAPIKLSFDAVP